MLISAVTGLHRSSDSRILARPKAIRKLLSVNNQRKVAVEISSHRPRIAKQQKRRERRTRKTSTTIQRTRIRNFAVSNGWAVSTRTRTMILPRYGDPVPKSRSFDNSWSKSERLKQSTICSP